MPVLPDSRPDRADPVRDGADNGCYVKPAQPASGTGCAIVIPSHATVLNFLLVRALPRHPGVRYIFIPRKGERGCEQRGGKSPGEAPRHDPAVLFIF